MGKKNNKKDKNNKKNDKQTSDEFDAMLAEAWASDPAILATKTTTTSISLATSVSPITATTVASSSSSSARSEKLLPMGPPTNPAAEAMEESMVSEKSILVACTMGDVRQLRKWGTQGVLIRNCNPLFYVVFSEKLDFVRCLVKDIGADFTQVNDDGCTPMCVAVMSGKLDMVRFQGTELRADVNQAGQDGRTPIIIVRYSIVELGADVNIRDNIGQTPLYTAVFEGDLDLVSLLLNLGANINLVDKDGSTPLMMASFNKHPEVVMWLVKAGADSFYRGCTFKENRRFCRADRVPGGQDALLECWLQWCWHHEVYGVQACAVLWGGVPAGALEGAQGRLQAVERRASGWKG
jgi:hypothetical protein